MQRLGPILKKVATRVLFAVLVWSAVPVGSARAQNQPGTLTVVPDDEEIRARPDSLKTPRKRKVRSKRDNNLRFSSDLAVSGVYNSSVSRDDDELSGQGMATSLILRLETRPAPTILRLRYGVSAFTFSEDDRWNRISQSGRLELNLQLDRKWMLEVVGWASLNTLTVEYLRSDLYTFMPRLTFEPDPTNRYLLYGALRHKVYDDLDGTTAFNPFAGAEYRRRWGSWHYLDVRGRLELNHSDVDRRRFEAADAQVLYTRPLGKHTRIRAGLRFRYWKFENRTFDLDGAEILLRDWRWSPTAALIQELPYGFRFDVEYLYDDRRSNDHDRRIDIHRLEGTLMYRIR